MAIDNETNPVVGFDLGTTFSALARWVDRKGPQIIQNRAGQDTTQSAIYYNPENDEILVGNIAYNKGLMTPENMIVGVKRLMDDGHQKIMLGGKEFTPISSNRYFQQPWQCCDGSMLFQSAPDGQYTQGG